MSYGIWAHAAYGILLVGRKLTLPSTDLRFVLMPVNMSVNVSKEKDSPLLLPLHSVQNNSPFRCRRNNGIEFHKLDACSVLADPYPTRQCAYPPMLGR